MMLNHMPNIHRHQPVAGRLSPIGSTTGPAVVELLQQMHSKKFDKDITMKAITTLRHAVKEATEVDDDGGDEVLYGRAGLLWALLNLRKEKAERNVAWIPDDILGDDLISYIVMAILEAGRRGKGKFGVEGLMWEWHGKGYLGAYVGVSFSNFPSY